jgi:hypothetical protein
MKTAFFTKRNHFENRIKANNGGAKGEFFWRPNHASKCPKRTQFKPIQTQSNQINAKLPPSQNGL